MSRRSLPNHGDVAERHCRPRRLDPGAPRPSELLAAFFTAALVMLVVAAIATVASTITAEPRLHWLALHLALLGGVSQLVLGAGQFFVCAFLATAPPPRRLVAGQLVVWNSGTAAVATGVSTSTAPLTDAGAILLVAGLALLSISMLTMQRRSLQRARWAVRWYQASAAYLGAGVLVGLLLARGVVWSHGSLLGTHLTLNLAGWLGTAIVGTLHTFFPSLTATQLRFPRLQGPTFALWTVGVLELALGAALTVSPLAAAGWLQLAGAGGLLAVNILGSLRHRAIVLALPARLITVAQVFLLAGLALALIATLHAGAGGALALSVRPTLAILLLAGWVGLTVAGSLLHLLAVLARVRHLAIAMPAPQPIRDRITTALAALAIVVWALAQTPESSVLDVAALVLRICATAVIGGQVLGAAARAGVTATLHPAHIFSRDRRRWPAQVTSANRR